MKELENLPLETTIFLTKFFLRFSGRERSFLLSSQSSSHPILKQTRKFCSTEHKFLFQGLHGKGQGQSSEVQLRRLRTRTHPSRLFFMPSHTGNAYSKCPLQKTRRMIPSLNSRRSQNLIFLKVRHRKYGYYSNPLPFCKQISICDNGVMPSGSSLKLKSPVRGPWMVRF